MFKLMFQFMWGDDDDDDEDDDDDDVRWRY